MAETTSLLRMRRGNSTEGSNPSRSATNAAPLFRVAPFFLKMDKTHTSATDLDWMNQALQAATDAELRGDVPVGCVVIHPERGVVGVGRNQREENQDPTAHAEIVALRQAAQTLGRWRLSDCTLYVTLEPCFMCAGAIVNARLKRVVYAASDAKAGACESLAHVLTDSRLNHRCELTTGVLEDVARNQLKEFFRKRRIRS